MKILLITEQREGQWNKISFETLAAAYAETGDFPSAVKWQKKAIEMQEPKPRGYSRSRLQLYNSDLMVASLYCWEKHIFPLAYVEVETDDEGKIQSIECRDDEWTLNYEMPPLKIMQIRLAGLSRIDPTHARRAASIIRS